MLLPLEGWKCLPSRVGQSLVLIRQGLEDDLPRLQSSLQN